MSLWLNSSLSHNRSFAVTVLMNSLITFCSTLDWEYFFEQALRVLSWAKAKSSTSLSRLARTSPSPWTPGAGLLKARWTRRSQVPEHFGEMPGEERNSWLRSSKSLNLRHPMEKPSKLQLCFHVTNVITWVPLKRGWNNMRGWNTRKLKLHLLPQKLSEESSRSLIGSPLPLYNREENCRNCDGPFSPGHQCGDEEKAGEDDGSDSEEEESDEDSEPPGDFDPPPVLTLLQTLSSLTDDDQKRAVLALQLQLNSIIDNKWDLHGDLYASLAGGICSCEDCLFIWNYSVFAYVT